MKYCNHACEIAEGDHIEVFFKNANPDSELYTNVYIPCLVLKKYSKWILLDVLPHLNPVRHYGYSRPYKMSMRNFDIVNGDVLVRWMDE